MTSMRKLRRRLQRWERYAHRVAFNPRINQPWAWQPPHGYQRAAAALSVRRVRCVNCAYGDCAGCWGFEPEGYPFVVTVPVDRRLL